MKHWITKLRQRFITMTPEVGQEFVRRTSLRCGGRQGAPLAQPRCAELRELKDSSLRP
jgi:hypothetical protein